MNRNDYPAIKILNTVNEAWSRSFYRDHWGCSINDALFLIKTGRFNELPVIRKTDISKNWSELIEYGDFTDVVSSSGTTGRPVDLPVHRLQEAVWIESVSKVLIELGAKPGDKLLQMLSNNDMFTLGPLVWQAAKKLGVGPFRCSPQRIKRIVDVIHYHRPKFVVGNPVVMMNLSETMGNEFPDTSDLPDYAYFGACSSFDSSNKLTPVAQKVKELWGLKDVLNEYGCSEIGSIGHECLSHSGFHINDEVVYVELIDPNTGLPAEAGSTGEVVVTTLSVPRGFIAVRYATGDVASWIDYEPCSCGRRTPRLGAIIGRVDHQLKILGQTVFPDLIFDAINSVKGLEDALIVRFSDKKSEQVELLVAGNAHDSEALKLEIKCEIEKSIAVSPFIRNVPADLIQKLKDDKMSMGNGVKVPRLIDLDEPSSRAFLNERGVS
jgi:phenylacetate-CoA ligase